MHYKVQSQSGGTKHLWDVSSLNVFDGGYLLDKTNLNDDVEIIEQGVPFALDHVERKAKVFNIVKVYANASASATSLQIAKGSYIKGTAKLFDPATGNYITCSAIDKSNTSYDALTVSALASTITANTVLYEVFNTTTKKHVVLYDGLAASATTSIKVRPGHGLVATDKLMQGETEITISGVAHTNADYDTLTVSSVTPAAADAGTILYAKTAVEVLPVIVAGMNYDDVKVDDETPVSAVFAASQVVKANLPMPFVGKLAEDLKYFLFV